MAAEVVNSLLPDDFKIKSKQLIALENIINGQDTLCVLPTGYGKSLIYQLLPVVFKRLENFEEPDPCVIVISPLLSLIKNQVFSASKHPFLNLRPCSLNDVTFKDVHDGKYNIMFSTPETFLSQKWRELFSSSFLDKNLVCLVVDEVHLVSWGHVSSDNLIPFREAFSKIKELRSLCRSNCPLLALSATVNCDLTELIKTSCSLYKFKVISECTARKNICLHVIQIKKKSVEPLNWVLDGLVEYGVDSPKIVIYCRTVKLVGWMYEEFLNCGRLSATEVRNLVGMYHSNTLESHKEKCLNSLTKPGFSIRVVIATSALGCGVDMESVNFVIHFGPSFDTVDYVQQIGRAGRGAASGYNQCHAIMYLYPRSTRDISQNMKNFIFSANEQCLRVFLYMPFSSTEVKPISPSHFCCTFCMKSCECCQNCSNNSTSCFDYTQFVVNKDTPPVRVVDATHKEVMRNCLMEYHNNFVSSRNQLSFLPLSVLSGVTEKVTEDILDHLPNILSFSYLTQEMLSINENLAREVLKIINEIFEENLDVPETNFKELTFAKFFDQNLTVTNNFSDFSTDQSTDDEF